MVGVGAGEPGVVGADGGADGAVAVVIADDIGAVGYGGVVGADGAGCGQTGQGGEGKLRVGEEALADAAVGIAEVIEIHAGVGEC